MQIYEIYGYFSVLFMGIILGLLGGGGSILTVPILVYIFKISPVLSTSYSLIVVGFTALVGAISYIKKQDVEIKTAILFSIPGFVGVNLMRTIVIPQIPNEILNLDGVVISKSILIMSSFALLMLMASRAMIFKKITEDHNQTNDENTVSLFRIAIQGFLVGIISGFVGAGGGFIIVPSLVFLIKLPMKKAVGTSLLIIAMNSILGMIGSLFNGPVFDWNFLMTVTGIAIIGMLIGVFSSKFVRESYLKKGFGYFVLIVGSLILIDQILKLKS